MLIAVAMVTSPAAGQHPTTERTSLVINEIMLNPNGTLCPWIEFLNPTDHTIAIDEFAVGVDSSSYFQLPRQAGGVLMPEQVLLVVVQIPECDVGLHRTMISVPAQGISNWRTQGTMSLRRRNDDSSPMNEWRLVDFVAWGRPPATHSIDQRELWPPTAFVPLQESLGFLPRDVEIQAGWSIGHYPGRRSYGPNEWVVFDEHETTPGWGNPVPFPKAFTMADGATVGSRSVAITWSRKNGDESYQFRLYRLPNTTDPIIDAACDMAAVRIGDALPDGEYLYTVVAQSGVMRSLGSLGRTFIAVDTPCDWPLPPDPSPGNQIGSLAMWLLGPDCPDPLECGLLPTIRFKFQRKDSPLRCSTCENDAEPGCPHNGIHPYCFNVVFADGRPTRHLCAGGVISPTCRRNALNQGLLSSGLAVSAVAAEATSTLSAAIFSPTIESCEHGDNYCAFASLSMVASVYGKCLSQDWIANNLCLIDNDPVCSDLSHNSGVHNQDATRLFAWTLGIPEGEIRVDPSLSQWGGVSTLQRPEPRAAFFNQVFPPVLTFGILKYWIDSNRAIMGRQGGHFHAVAGYCVDPPPGNSGFATRKWLYVFDSRDGPKIQPFTTWLKLTAAAPANSNDVTTPKGVWVGPPDSWSATKKDDPAVWEDSNGDGMSDYDEARP